MLAHLLIIFILTLAPSCGEKFFKSHQLKIVLTDYKSRNL